METQLAYLPDQKHRHLTFASFIFGHFLSSIILQRAVVMVVLFTAGTLHMLASCTLLLLVLLSYSL
jgi:hypothetical protein